MGYDLAPWQDAPSSSTPITAGNLSSVPVFLDGRQYGVKGDNSTDNATPLASLAAAVRDAGPGARGILPTGTILTSGPLRALGDGSWFQGHGNSATILKKTAGFDLVTMNGTNGSTLRSRCGLSHMRLDGGNHTGRLLDVVYASEHWYDHIHFSNNTGTSNTEPGVDLVQCWDSQLSHCIFDSITPSDGTMPALYIRASRAPSGFGTSTDSSNQIHVSNCNFVSNKGPDLWIGKGGASVGSPTDTNQIYVTTNKFESQYIRNHRIITDPSVHDCHIERAFLNLVNFDSGFLTAVDGINFQAAEFCSLRKIWIANGGVATVKEGIWSWMGADNMQIIDQIWGNYATTPTTGFHVNLAGGLPVHLGRVDAINATPVGGLGTTIQTYGPGPVRSVAGSVSDASFARVPPVGTMAMDTTNSNFYVKQLGTNVWKKVALA